jgi:hypothetical protein
MAVGEHLALALAAGAVAAKAEGAAAAIGDRRRALARAVARRSAKIDLGAIDADPASESARTELAAALDEHGASTDRDVVTTAKELLALINLDDPARDALGERIEAVTAALGALSEIDLDALPEPTPASAEAPPALTTSRRFLAPVEPSKTELEREALPIWQRTENFFTKLAIVSGLVLAGIVAWFVLRPNPEAALDACRGGDKSRCWEVVTAADAIDQGRSVPDEPLRLLCDRDQDACGCAGLAYVAVAQAGAGSDCGGLQAATALDPRWPCTCRRYEFWHPGELRTSQCGIPRCE